MKPASIKLDDGSSFATNCFPARKLNCTIYEGGAWVVAVQMEKVQNSKLMSDSLGLYSTASEIRALQPSPSNAEKDDSQLVILDKKYLLQLSCVERSTDLSVVDIAGTYINSVAEDELKLFSNVAYVNASETRLPIHIFNGFVSLRELDLSLSDVRGITLSTEAFLQLQVLNLAYNNLCDADILALGKLKCIRILNLSSNQLSTLPENLAVRDWHGGSAYFRSLEELTLESNYLSGESTFFCLAGLPRLKHLNLRGNGLCAVPHLSIKDSCFKADEVKGLTVLHKKVNKGTQKATRHTTITALSNQGLHDSNDAQAFVSRSAQYIGAMNYLGLSLQVVKHAVTPACIKPHSHESKETITTNLQLKQKNSESSGIAQEKQPTENLGLLKNENEEHYINISKPAFPCLQYLDLSCNKVRDEKCLLAIASYPMLTELVLYGNPLATNTKGCPPLLEHCLANRLGITIVREKPMPESRVHLQTRNVMSRQVKKKIHSVPDKSLMLKQDQIECISGKEISPEKYSGTEITEIMTFNYAPDHPHVTCSHQPRQPSYHQQQCPGDLVNKFERTQEVLATQTFAPSQDMNLDSIMDKHPSSKEYKDAMRLLQRVQTKYYSACNSSVQYSRKARAFAEINAYTPVSE